MDEHIYKSHNKTLLLYHFVFPAKYRKKIFDDAVDEKLREVCIEISERYEINFVEIGNDIDHVHILVQSVPTITVSRVVTIIKSITAKEIFKEFPQLKKDMWGSSLWTSGYYANTVGMYAGKDTIVNYIKNQGGNEKDYVKIHQGQLQFDL
ncbi:MAG: IS200/IS605 family transposase [Sulfurimonas sp.]|nr:IS200/IS605 family transposase [Sulfurimonas sp.]